MAHPTSPATILLDVFYASLWYRRKPYLHFDVPLSEAKAAAYVCDPNKVTRHAFYPFLRYELLTSRKKKNPAPPPPVVDNTKPRPISYPAHLDGYIFSYYKSILEQPYEEWLAAHDLGSNVTAFRKNHENNVSLAQKAFKFISDAGHCEIVVADIESFFDNIDHRLLKQRWASCLSNGRELPADHYAVYKALTRYSFVERHKVYNLFRIPLPPKRSRNRGRICTPLDFSRALKNGCCR